MSKQRYNINNMEVRFLSLAMLALAMAASQRPQGGEERGE